VRWIQLALSFARYCETNNSAAHPKVASISNLKRPRFTLIPIFQSVDFVSLVEDSHFLLPCSLRFLQIIFLPRMLGSLDGWDLNAQSFTTLAKPIRN
jgi:hypothetical protein